MAQESLTENERKRFRAQYNEIATLAGGLAHEIRNPLSTISLNLQLLQEDLEDDNSPKSRRAVQRIQTLQQECENLEIILKEFLQFARIGELDLVPSDLNQIVSDFIEFYRPLATEAGIGISPHLKTDLPKILLDTSLMRQVLMNLAINAQQAMPEGGLLELQTDVRENAVRLDLIDTGIGMNQQTTAKMFEAFYSLKSDGSGLGLPTVRKIVQAHGGEITCESEPGKGTRFTISFPIVK